MPAVSKKQAGFMGMIASGKMKKKGLSKEKAKEFLRGVKVKDLPKKKSKSNYEEAMEERKQMEEVNTEMDRRINPKRKKVVKGGRK